jgi:hypothetical protein
LAKGSAALMMSVFLFVASRERRVNPATVKQVTPLKGNRQITERLNVVDG